MSISYLVDGKPVSLDVYNQTLAQRSRGGAGGPTATGNAPGGFNLNPGPQGGVGPFGAVPGPLGLPDPAGDLGRQIPNLPAINSAASAQILAKLNGQLSPGTLNALKNASAQFGVSSGMPGSGLSSNSFLGNVAGASEAQAQQGLQAYMGFTPTVSNTQTVNPALQNEIATQNSLNAAAPNPAAAASYAQEIFNSYLSQMRGPGGGTRGGPSPGAGTLPAAPVPAPTRSAGPAYFNPQSVAPTGPGTFGGASNNVPFNPQTWADWESEMYDMPANYYAPALNDLGGYGNEAYGPPEPTDLYWE